MKPGDLLDPEKMKKFEEETKEIFAAKSKAKTPEILKKIEKHDNLESLNRLGTETGKILEWGIDTDD